MRQETETFDAAAELGVGDALVFEDRIGEIPLERHISYARATLIVLRVQAEKWEQERENVQGYVRNYLLQLFDELAPSGLSLADIEELLRSMRSRIHLLALPLEVFGEKVQAYLPFS